MCVCAVWGAAAAAASAATNVSSLPPCSDSAFERSGSAGAAPSSSAAAAAGGLPRPLSYAAATTSAPTAAGQPQQAYSAQGAAAAAVAAAPAPPPPPPPPPSSTDSEGNFEDLEESVVHHHLRHRGSGGTVSGGAGPPGRQPRGTARGDVHHSKQRWVPYKQVHTVLSPLSNELRTSCALCCARLAFAYMQRGLFTAAVDGARGWSGCARGCSLCSRAPVFQLSGGLDLRPDQHSGTGGGVVDLCPPTQGAASPRFRAARLARSRSRSRSDLCSTPLGRR